MKIRIGFVSNSSSSSFIIYDDKFYKHLNFLGYEFQIKEEGEAEIEIIVDDKFNGYSFDVLKTIEEKIEYLTKCVINRPCLILNEEDCEDYKKLEKEYYDSINNNYDKVKINNLQGMIEELKWKAIDILFTKIETLVKEVKEVIIIRVKEPYIHYESIPEKDFFENDEKLKEFLYSGAVYFGNDNINDFEIPIGHYIVYNENKNSKNIYYLRNSNHLIYDFDKKNEFKDIKYDYFKCLSNFFREKNGKNR